MTPPAATRTMLVGRAVFVWLTIVGVLLVLMSFASTRSVLGVTQHAGNWTVFAFDDRVQNDADDKHVNVPGESNTIEGDIKSNGDAHVSGNLNTFGGLFRFYDPPFNEPGNDNSYIAGEPQQEMWTDWPG